MDSLVESYKNGIGSQYKMGERKRGSIKLKIVFSRQ